VKAQRILAASALALLLVCTAPVARASGNDQPIDAPQSFVECLGEVASAMWGVVSSVL
jgi:hypothetical protein